MRVSRFGETCDPHPALRAALSQRERDPLLDFFTSFIDRPFYNFYSASNVLGYLDSNSTRFPVPGWRKLKYSP